MAFTDALVCDPFMVNEQLVDSLLQEPDSFEVWLANLGASQPPGQGP